MALVVSSASQAIVLTSTCSQSTQSLSWTDFFTQELFLPEEVDGIHIIHHAYLTPPSETGPLFVMHHGAGSSGLSFATCAEELRKILPKAGVLSLDARSHGRTTMIPKSKSPHQDSPSTGAAAQAEADGKIELDLSLDTLSRDLVFVVRETQARMGWETLPDIVLVGHSLGGAVITDVAKKGDLGSKLLAYAVLDVVEGNFPALSLSTLALVVLNSFYRVCYGCPPEYGELSLYSTNPISFTNIRNRVAVSSLTLSHRTLLWCTSKPIYSTRSRTIRNTTSARASVPSLIYEETEPTDPSRPWVWRTNLSATKPFWENWFIGLSRKFLDARGGKLLLLAGTDRLDKELMIGQMQGTSTILLSFLAKLDTNVPI